jgi:hypothetical protein
MSPSDPLFDLLASLRKGTSDKTIEWQQADSQGDAFIARRPGGTVTLRGTKPTALDLASAPAVAVTMVVKDAQGATVEKYDAVQTNPLLGGIVAAMSGASGTDSALRGLYSEVREQVTKAKSTMRRLSKEFERPG